MSFREKCTKMLFLLQCAYQQKVISQTDKNGIAAGVKTSLQKKNFEPVRLAIDRCICLKPERKHLIDEMYQLIKEDYDEFFK